jgi:hypothetical protein
MRRTWRVRAGLLAVIVAALASDAHAVDGVKLIDQARALAGNVSPGDGPGFPVTISVPGSYQLSSDLTVPPNTTAIAITTANVTLNLNGFNILGNGGSSGSGIESAFANVAVANGTVSGMGGSGVDVGDHARVERVRALSNGRYGVLVGSRSTVVENTASFNGLSGIRAGGVAMVTGNAADDNAENGVTAGAGSSVTGNKAGGNDADGIIVEIGSTVSGNTAFANAVNGISVRCPSAIVGNTSTGSGGVDFFLTGVNPCTTAHNAP